MKIIEEQLLNNTILQLNNYKKSSLNIFDFYQNIDSLNIESLQNFSFQKDNEFFDEVSLILSVISSIIAHPHISNKGEDIILRAELAGHLSNESFQKVLKEANLWKEKDLEMVPEYVHHYQYTDELKIYENLFIGMLINLLSDELTKYRNFYTSLIPSIDSENEYSLMDTVDAEKGLTRLDKLERKIRFIKNTYFYKEVSKENLNLRNIQPTNILVKDMLYNKCFKFYRKFIKYDNQESLFEDFKTYYYYLILKTFKQRNYTLIKDDEQTFESLSFKNELFKFNLKNTNNNYLNLTISLLNSPNISENYYLTFDIGKKTSIVPLNISDSAQTNTISIWNLYDEKPIFKNNLKETKLIDYFIDSKIRVVDANTSVYMKHCPGCKNQNVREEDGIIYCQDCKSKYTIFDNKLWLIKLTRR